MKKVLILYAPLGSGHKLAADAIAQAFVEKYPDIEVRNVDVLDFISKSLRHSLPWAYNFVTARFPFVYKCFYGYYNGKLSKKQSNNILNIILKKSHFINFINEFNPDLIISTNPLPMQLVSKTKEKKIINIPSANVCTDFGFHSLWVNPDVNFYFVANEEIKKALIKYGVGNDKIVVTGIPTNPKFNKTLDHQIIVDKLGFNFSEPIILIVGGATSHTSFLRIINGLKNKNKKLQFIIVAGRDKTLQKKLKESKINKDPFIAVFDFVHNLDEYMTVADLILTKAGGLTVSECLVKNLPMVINNIIPGQEEDNVEYIVKNGAGIRTKNVEETVNIINDLFLNPKKLSAMGKSCKKLAKPNAAKDIVDFVVSKI